VEAWLYWSSFDAKNDLLRFGRRKPVVVRRRVGGKTLLGYLLIDLVPPWQDRRDGDGPWLRAVLDGLLIPPTREEAAEWRAAVFAMRDLARRVKGWRPKPARKGAALVRIDQLTADAIARRHVALCRPLVRESARPLRTFDRVVLVPTLPTRVRSFGDGASAFWQEIFGSMTGFGGKTCGDCGGPLPDSPTGRRSRAERCRGCRAAKFRSKFSDDEWRERERRRQAKYRANINKGD
jgi:hypothetical protein